MAEVPDTMYQLQQLWVYNDDVVWDRPRPKGVKDAQVRQMTYTACGLNLQLSTIDNCVLVALSLALTLVIVQMPGFLKSASKVRASFRPQRGTTLRGVSVQKSRRQTFDHETYV